MRVIVDDKYEVSLNTNERDREFNPCIFTDRSYSNLSRTKSGISIVYTFTDEGVDYLIREAECQAQTATVD